MTRVYIFLAIIGGVFLFSYLSNSGGGSGGSSAPQQWTNIDLDRVLEITEATMAEALPPALADEAPVLPGGPGVPGDAAAATPTPEDAQPFAAEVTTDADVALLDADADPEVAAITAAFNDRLSDNLNAASLHPKPVQTTMMQDGSIMGFEDPDGDGAFTPGETPLFLIQADAANQRLIASDLQDPEVNRESGYTYRPGGFFTGYLIGSMLGGQNRYYGRGGAPGLSNMRMAPKGYARSGSGFKTRASSRTMGGSKSFLGGK